MPQVGRCPCAVDRCCRMDGRLRGQPGRTYAKVLRDDWTGEQPTAAYWRPVTIVADTGCAAYATDRSRYTFDLPPGGRGQVTARLVFRQAYQELMQQRGGPSRYQWRRVVRVGSGLTPMRAKLALPLLDRESKLAQERGLMRP